MSRIILGLPSKGRGSDAQKTDALTHLERSSIRLGRIMTGFAPFASVEK